MSLGIHLRRQKLANFIECSAQCWEWIVKVVHHQEEPSFTICCALGWPKLPLEILDRFFQSAEEPLGIELMRCDSNAMEPLSPSGGSVGLAASDFRRSRLPEW